MITVNIEFRLCVNRISQIILKCTVKQPTKKHTTCLATFLQIEFSSNVAHFDQQRSSVFSQISLLTGLNLGGKCATSRLLQQCCKASCTFFLPVLLTLKCLNVSMCEPHLPLTVMETVALLADPMELLATHL